MLRLLKIGVVMAIVTFRSLVFGAGGRVRRLSHLIRCRYIFRLDVTFDFRILGHSFEFSVNFSSDAEKIRGRDAFVLAHPDVNLRRTHECPSSIKYGRIINKVAPSRPTE